MGSAQNLEDVMLPEVGSRRALNRENGISDQYPVSCRIYSKNFPDGINAEVLNYHYGGVCLKFQESDVFRVKHITQFALTIDFFLGSHLLKSRVPVRVAWYESSMPGLLGLQFLVESRDFIERSRRYRVNDSYQPTLSVKDPLDIHRVIYFKVRDFSANGLLLNTSLTNKHLFPGMILKQAELSIPGQNIVTVDLKIENARKGITDTTFDLGVSLQSEVREFRSAIQTYMSHLVPDAALGDSLIEDKKKNDLAAGLTFRIISEERDYQEVLKLRYLGYGFKGKVREGTGARDQGDGLQNEGTVLGAWLGGKLVASMELRFAGKTPFRLFKFVSKEIFSNLPLDWSSIVEMNKLVVHPDVQGTDILTGMVQKAHAICMTRGAPDVMLFATDALKPMYQRIGAQETGVTFAHPQLPGVTLHVLILTKEAFLDGRFMKAEVWKKYYEETNKFYQERIYRNGVVSAPKRSFIGRFKNDAEKLEAITPASPRNFVLKEKDDALFVDPKWTQQHISAPVMVPYLMAGDRLITPVKVDEILADMGIGRGYFRSQSNWLSIEFLDGFIERYSKFGDVDEVSRLSGQLTLDKEVIGLNYYIMRHFLSPELAFRAFTSSVKKFNRTRTFEVEMSKGRCIIKLGLVERKYLPRHRCSDLNWLENIRTYINILTKGKGSARQISSPYDGDIASVFEVTWPVMSERKRRVGEYLVDGALGVAASGTMWAIASPTAGAFAFAATIAGKRWLHNASEVRRNRRSMNDVTKRIEDINEDNARKYETLQVAKLRLDKRYHEAQILDESARLIQSCDGLAGIYRTALQTVCNRFQFNRAFLMLLDESENCLKTTAIEGVQEHSDRLWSYRVDVSMKREGALFLSSAFHSGQSVVINDLESHFFQLNEQSRRLIQGLGGSKGFVIVPVPAANGSCGVLIAERDTEALPIKQDDVVILQRLCQHIGIAIERFGKLEREKKLRTLFQKYVPQAVLDSLLAEATPELGGVQKEIVCMFLDIRGFTRISSMLPPHVVLDMLNRVFAVVGKAVEASGGVIDKFLGDGVLAVWGSVPGSHNDVERILAAIESMDIELLRLSTALEKEGLPAIRVGIGLHKGPAIVGNIGSEDRLEFTCIGNAVNLASRLEALCKEYHTGFAMTESTLPQAANAPHYLRIEGVSVRGIEEKINIIVRKTAVIN